MPYQPIENYGVIGNMQSIALVSIEGSIDFLCYPNFDSPTLFAALLDDKKGGYFQISPKLDDRRIRQLYLPETNILLTRFLSEDGLAELTDYMPVDRRDGNANEIVRNVKVIRGSVDFTLRCAPRFNYARNQHSLTVNDGHAIFTPADTEAPPLALLSTIPLTAEGNDVAARFTLHAGESANFVFGAVHKDMVRPDLDAIEDQFRKTSGFWKSWIGRSKYRGRWREMVNRSALLLKMLMSEEYGSMVAAPTFSLPEEIGGVRNWDYRYTWLRDATFSLYALIRLGYVDESESFIAWLKDRLSDDAERGPLQVMYGIDGRQKLDEYELENLDGYEGSRPVRVGNAAYQQLQLDIYGEMMDSVYLATKYGKPLSYEGWQGIQRILAWLAKNWQRPDEGIWEVRGGAREFVHSRMMCWVAFDRALRLGIKRSLPGPLDEWRKLRDEIRDDIFTNFWNPELQSFVQSRGSKNLDASVLLMPLVRFISPIDPMWLSTMKAIETHLVEDTLVYRYDAEGSRVDGLPGGEGSFTACSFWYVECLARAGQLDKAELLFEKLLGYANHLGLYSEQLGTNGRHLGNFPQAFTHLALISAATFLDRALSGDNDGTWR